MTSKAMAIQLKAAGIPFVVGSTRGANASAPGIDAVKFDWTDASTFPLPFQHSFPNGEKITAVYIVSGPLADPGPAVNAFVDYAMKEQGVKRFVVCAGGSTRKGDPRLGAVWAHLEDVGAEYLVLRPTWFIGKYSFIRLKRNIPRFSTVGARRLTPSRPLFGVVPPDPQEREQDLHVLRGCDYGLRQRGGYRGARYQGPHL